ncbi:armadillo-type protein [Spinellus fusiger]|nr:armadillo-type protein [Spinellus fusiger]
MEGWQPTERGLSDLIQLFHLAINPTDGQNVEKRLAYYSTLPDYNSYLVYILVEMPHEDQYVRSVAGLTLKNNIRQHFVDIPMPVMNYIKQACLQHMGDITVGKSVSLVIAAIMACGHVQQWPHALTVILEKLDDPEPAVVENAMNTLHKLCEDCAEELDRPLGDVVPLEYILPKLIAFFQHPNCKIRYQAITAVNHFIALRSKSLVQRMPEFLNALFLRATDDDVTVRKALCRSLVALLDGYHDALLPQMATLVDYMLYSTQSDDPDLALEACEFWLVFSEQGELRGHLRPFLVKIVPVLLGGMVYSTMDLLMLEGESDDAHVVDRDQDIKPRFYKSQLTGADRAHNGQEIQSQGNYDTIDSLEERDDYDDYDDYEDDEDDEGYDDEATSEWSLRKCSAATLDTLCHSFKEEVVAILIPMLKIELESPDWLHRECGILALGAVAEGGINEIASHLNELIPYLLTHMNDSKPLVRSITCWTLGRYCPWILQISRQNYEARQRYFEPLIQLLLERILDNNKRVQDAACSSFLRLEDEALEDLVPYLGPILSALATAFDKYQKRNLLLLYDTISTLATSVGHALNTPQFINIIMPPLIQKWQEIPDTSRDLFPLLECISSVTSALGKGFLPFAEPVYMRAVVLVLTTLRECQLAAHHPSRETPEKDSMVVALDLLSNIVQALNTEAEPLVAKTQPPVAHFLSVCLVDEVAEVRQAAYALLGDLAISCFEHIRAMLPQCMHSILQQIEPQTNPLSVCNNAAWAAGEIALKWGNGPEIQPYIEPLLQRLLLVLSNPTRQRTLTENAAIAIGRLGLIFPHVVAVHLESFAHAWLIVLAPIRENDEKSSAFSGLCETIKSNPQGIIKEFIPFCTAIANYQNPPKSLHESFGNILSGYKNMFGDEQWQQGLASMPQDMRMLLHERYNI